MRQDTAKHSRAFWKDTLNKPYHIILTKGVFKMKYVCNLCGWVYDEEEAGVKWEDLPDDFACELCGAGKDEFTAEE